MKLVLILGVVLLLSGCSTGSLKISKCDKFENDICINSVQTSVSECKNPQIIEGKTYCK